MKKEPLTGSFLLSEQPADGGAEVQRRAAERQLQADGVRSSALTERVGHRDAAAERIFDGQSVRDAIVARVAGRCDAATERVLGGQGVIEATVATGGGEGTVVAVAGDRALAEMGVALVEAAVAVATLRAVVMMMATLRAAHSVALQMLQDLAKQRGEGILLLRAATLVKSLVLDSTGRCECERAYYLRHCRVPPTISLLPGVSRRFRGRSRGPGVNKLLKRATDRLRDLLAALHQLRKSL